MQRASADAEHPDIYIGSSETVLRHEGGSSSYSSTRNYSYHVSWNQTKNRYVIRKYDVNSSGVEKLKDEYDDLPAQEHIGNGTIYEGSPVRAAAKAVMEALNHGVSITDVRKMMQDSGIDESGPVINISKPMNTKDIHVDGSITTTGGICMASASRSGLAKTRVRATLTRK